MPAAAPAPPRPRAGGAAVEVIPLGAPEDVGPGDSIAAAAVASAARRGGVRDGDVLVVSQKIVSKQEGRVVRLDAVSPSPLAAGIAAAYGKDPRVVELVLSEARRILRMRDGVIVTETRAGLVCANSGVDESNAGRGGGLAVLLPEDPDASAERLRLEVERLSGARIAVAVSDTFGRPFRAGQADCAIGVSGLGPVLEYAGRADAYGRRLRVTAVAVADELCAAAELVKGKSSGTPMALVRNYAFEPGPGSARGMLRPEGQDLFR